MNHLRRTAAVLAVLLGTTTLTALGAPPAGAAPGCLQDVPVVVLLTPDGCDDTTAPETSFGATAPRINAAGWITKTTIRVGITGRHTDADTDPLTLQCRLSLDPAVPAEADWTTCPGNGVFANLQQTATPYVLWARAVDANDQAVAWSDGTPFNGTDETLPDLDQSPARLEFRVDSQVPDSVILGTPRDPLSPDVPMVTDLVVPLRLSATEPGTFVCTLDAVVVPCTSGDTRLRDVGPGEHTLDVQAVDVAGNVDPSPATTRFAVPTDLTTSKRRGHQQGGTSGSGDWKRVVDRDFLGDSYVVATTKGTELRVQAGPYREVRLLAATGPRAGTVQVKLGRRWHRVSLQRRTTTERDQIQVVQGSARHRGGPVVIRVLSQGKRVQLDGILLR